MSTSPFAATFELSEQRDVVRLAGRIQPLVPGLGREMADADRAEAMSLGRFWRLARLQREVHEARRADAAMQRLELRLELDATVS